MVFGERNRIFDLGRNLPDVHVDAALMKARHRLGIEVGHRSRGERHPAMAAVAESDHELVIDEVELDVEDAGAIGDRRGRQAPRPDIYPPLPPLLDPAGKTEADLPPDLT